MKIYICPEAPSWPTEGSITAFPTTATHCIWCGLPLDQHTVHDGLPGAYDARTFDRRTPEEHHRPVRKEEA